MPNEQLSSGKGQAGAQPPVYWMHILGITLLLTQSRLVLPAHSESTTAWLMSTALCFVGGAVAAGLWNVARSRGWCWRVALCWAGCSWSAVWPPLG